MPVVSTINREAGDKAKGPRLQRLRCIYLILDAIEKSEKPHIYAAVEVKDDVFIKDIKLQKDYLEQNKNFDEETKFTFNSHEIINTMIGFCDMWVEYIIKSKEVYLGFYATNNIGKESKSATVVKLNIDLPDKPILELLKEYDFDCPKLLPAVKALVIAEYKEQYKGKNGDGNIKNLEAFTDEDWKAFLKKIDWKFGECNEEETQKLVLGKLQSCKLFNHTHIGQEEIILRNLMDLLDERQCVTDLLGKFVNLSDVKLIFSQVSDSAAILKADDPIFKIWSQIPPPIDKRNIIDKIQAVCSQAESKRISFYARKTSGSRILQDDKSLDKNFLSLRYRIFEKCAEELEGYLKKIPAGTLTSQEEVDKLFDFLYAAAKNYVSTLSTDFNYTLKSDPVIEGIVLELFDSCYLALN
jgi:hypothetical protein